MTVAALAALLQAAAPASVAWLRFEHHAILQGEAWRLLTGHLVHLGWMHYAMNMLGLAAIASLFPGPVAPYRILVLMTVSALTASLGLLIFSAGINWYVGLSGVLHGLFAAAAIFAFAAGRRIEGGILIGLLVFKLFWEQIAGPVPGSEAISGGRVIVDAHLYGALGGLLAAVVQIKCYPELRKIQIR